MSNANLELNDLTKFRLDEINKIKDIVKKISKCIVAFDYIDKPFITLSASFGT